MPQIIHKKILTCKICGAPITRNAKRELCLNCAARDSWIRRRQHGADNNAERKRVKAALSYQIRQFGPLPICAECQEKCRQYNAPNLTRFICKQSPQYEAIALRMESIENYLNPRLEERMKNGLT